MKNVKKFDVKDIVPSDADELPYHLLEDEEWRLEMVDSLCAERKIQELDGEEQDWLQHLSCD